MKTYLPISFSLSNCSVHFIHYTARNPTKKFIKSLKIQGNFQLSALSFSKLAYLMPRRKNLLTKILCWIGLFLIVASIVQFLNKYCSIDHGLVKIDIAANQARSFAASLYFTKLERIGQISLALIGALWIFLIGKDRAIRFKTPYHIVLFVITNIFLLASFGAYFLGSEFLVNLIFYHSTIDLDAPIVKFWSSLQLCSFILGLCYLGLTVLLSKK